MRKLFFANWKTYLSDTEAETLARSYAERAAAVSADLAIAPGFTALEGVARALEGSSVALGAQDAFWNDEGAHTGEVTPKQLAAIGARFVIVGHSERRALGETDELIARKAAAVAADGMTPVLCVGETAEERDASSQERVVQAQLEAVLGSWTDAPFVVAYEPRWAIGTGRPCEPKDVEAMHAFIRSKLEERNLTARVLYGGSVDPSNLMTYLAVPNVDGVLIGGASTKPAEVLAMLDLLAS
ncbi:MAG: triose-phosphate isomerase [Patescibacteria group bacterium]|nr:MAG: triose-phosphate isomerase [Patescibacteria group bacterium]